MKGKDYPADRVRKDPQFNHNGPLSGLSDIPENYHIAIVKLVQRMGSRPIDSITGQHPHKRVINAFPEELGDDAIRNETSAR